MCTVYKGALFSPCIVCTLDDLCTVHNVHTLDLCIVHNVHTLDLCTVHSVHTLDLCIVYNVHTLYLCTVHNVHTLDLCTVHYAKCEATKQFPLRRLSTQDENIRLVIARVHKNGRLE